MSFKNVEIKKQANIYHDGKVTSRTVIMSDGGTLTLGVMLPGVYSFDTQARETIDITQGRCRVKLPENSHWSEYRAGQHFDVPANSRFDIEVVELLDYVCRFIK